jgi:HD-GYP domain-containing protein (c-di-GMP phosphodiesterase class II)
MVSDRAHRPALSHEAAMLELLSCAGPQFDPTVVEAFTRASARRDPHLAATAA